MINTFFNLGDTVYRVIEGGKFVPHRCELCNGTGLLTIMESDKKMVCFDCNGRKIIEVWENRIAMMVKLADLKDNMDISRLRTIGQKDIERLIKYHNAYRFIQSKL